MNLKLKDINKSNAQARFITGDTVNILEIFDKDRVNVTPALAGDKVCTEMGTSGMFQWPYANLDDIPTEYEEYTWTMENQLSAIQSDVDTFEGEDPRCFFSVPFDVDVSKLGINKGDSFEPEIRIDTNSQNLNVAVEFSDMDVYIYKATSDIADRGDGVAGGNEQVKLVAQGDTFQIFRIFLSGDETTTFTSNFVDMKITAETKDGKTQTVKKKIAFSQTPSIGFDVVP